MFPLEIYGLIFSIRGLCLPVDYARCGGERPRKVSLGSIFDEARSVLVLFTFGRVFGGLGVLKFGILASKTLYLTR
jgi:hypothetical protein